jgi:hypothetical protein
MGNELWSPSPSSCRSAARWVVCLPLLLVGSMLFWTMALGSGALSLLAVVGLSEVNQDLAPAEMAPTATEPMPGHATGDSLVPIIVHLQESAEPEDVNDNLGAVGPIDTDDDGTGSLPAQGQALSSTSDPN